jgi:hypothetical protein
MGSVAGWTGLKLPRLPGQGEISLDEKTVRKLEKRIEKAIVEVICDMGLRSLPLLPSGQTMHLMAKAAVAVYEAAVENHDRRRIPEEPVEG